MPVSPDPARIKAQLVPPGPPGSQGSPGLQGLTGPAGAQGPAGTATAWGSVDGGGIPSFRAKSVNVASVTRPPAGPPSGLWCITFAEPISIERRIGAVVSPQHSNPAPVVNILLVNNTIVERSDCPGGLVVAAIDLNDFTFPNTSFTFIVP